jgi:hypothetical protein
MVTPRMRRRHGYGDHTSVNAGNFTAWQMPAGLAQGGILATERIEEMAQPQAAASTTAVRRRGGET